MHAGQRLYTLDGLRGIAAVIVMLCHLEPAVRLAPGGYLAVDFFFALSGVVIAENYGPRLRSTLGRGDFMRQRLIRLYPLFAVGLLLGLLRAASQIALHQPSAMPMGEIVMAFALGLLMLPSVASIPPIYPLLSPAWTLMFELVSNAMYAAGLMRWRVGVLLLLCAAAAAGLWMVKGGTGALNRGGSWPELHIGLLRVTFSFFIGVALYEGALRRMPVRPTWLAPVPIAVAAALMIVDVEPARRGLYDWTCIVLIFPVLLFLGARWNAPAVLRGAFAWLGQVSYPLYTIHYPLIFVATYGARRAGVPPTIWVPALTLVLLVAATLLARWVDRPARRWMDERSRALIDGWRRGPRPPRASA